MRMLPYARALFARRLRGEAPWLAIVTIGSAGQRQLARRAFFAWDAGVARIWLPDDFNLAQADPAPFLGLDVLIVPECTTERLLEALGVFWRAQAATLWLCDEQFRATRLYPYRRFRGPDDLVEWTPMNVPLDRDFRARSRETRAAALAAGEEPLFSRAEFAQARREASSERVRALEAAA